MKNTFLFLLFCLSCALKAQITVINPGTPAPDRIHISVIDNKIVVSGDYNFIKRSNNECSTFIPLAVPEPTNSNILTRVDTSLSYMLTKTFSYSRIYKSINGGLTWTQKYNTNQDIVGLGFFDSSNVVGITNSYNIIMSNNGGITWTVILGPAQGVTSSKMHGDSAILIGNSGGNIYFSKNRGSSWITSTTLGHAVSGISFLDKDTIFVTSLYPSFGNAFKRSFNGGNSWSTLNSPPLATVLNLYFKSKNEGYILGEDGNGKGTILKTTDLGQNWITFNTNLTGGLIDMSFLNDSIALVSGYNGILFKWNTKQTQFVGIKNNLQHNINLSPYPNPLEEKLTIDIENKNADKINFSLTNSLGQPINTTSKIINTKLEIDTSELPKGIYYLKVQNNSGQKVFKLVKE